MGWTRQPAKRSLVTHVNNESGRREKEQGTRLHTAKQKKKRRANVRRRASNQAHTSTHTRSKRALSPLLFSFPFLSLVVTSEWAENEEYTNNNEGRAKGGQKKKKESNERRGKERKWDPWQDLKARAVSADPLVMRRRKGRERGRGKGGGVSEGRNALQGREMRTHQVVKGMYLTKGDAERCCFSYVLFTYLLS
jgi:hypothetical protein